MSYYDKISKGYNELHKEEQQNKLKMIKSIIQLDKNTMLLDVGCGTGLSSDFNCNVVGIDSSLKMLKMAKSKFSDKLFIQAKAEYLPFKESCFDTVISVTAVHNFDDIATSLKEMKRVGKSDYIVSILKKSAKLPGIREQMAKIFKIITKISENKDVIFFLK